MLTTGKSVAGSEPKGKGQLQKYQPTHQAISPFWKVGEARADAVPGTVRRTHGGLDPASPFPEAGSVEGSLPR